MTNTEFNDYFDILYNNITSNLAPGLDMYEKSVLLTMAQDDIIKAYFDTYKNKVLQGFDLSRRRQADFSRLINIERGLLYPSSTLSTSETKLFFLSSFQSTELDFSSWIINEAIEGPNSEIIGIGNRVNISSLSLLKNAWTFIAVPSVGHFGELGVIVVHFQNSTSRQYLLRGTEGTIPTLNGTLMYVNYTGFTIKRLDNRSTIVRLRFAPMFIINEVGITTNGKQLVIVPIKADEYNKYMLRPFKYPLKNQAWRLLNISDSEEYFEVITGINDALSIYEVRYIRRPQPIILEDLSEGLTINNMFAKSECELDPILHEDILKRAVELGKAMFLGDITTTIALGTNSSTDLGMLKKDD